MSNIITMSRGKSIDRAFDISDLTEGASDVGVAACVSKAQTAPAHCLANDWTNQEIATLYRAKRLLSGFASLTTTDRGLTDDGSPWFVFCDAEGEVLVHIARIDGVYILDGVGLPGPMKGYSFDDLIGSAAQVDTLKTSEVRSAISNILKLKPRKQTKIFIHPAANFAALIWAAATLDQAGDPWAQDPDHLAPEDAAMTSAGAFLPSVLVASAVSSSSLVSGDSVFDTAALVKLENSLKEAQFSESTLREDQAHGDDFNHKIAFFNVVLGVLTSILAPNNFQPVLDADFQEILTMLDMGDATPQDSFAPHEVSMDSVLEFIQLNVAMLDETLDLFHAQRLEDETEVPHDFNPEMLATSFALPADARVEFESNGLDTVALPAQDLRFSEDARQVPSVDLSNASSTDGSVSSAANPPLTAAASSSDAGTPVSEAFISVTALSVAGVFGLVISETIDARALSFSQADAGAVSSASAPQLVETDLGLLASPSHQIPVPSKHLTYTGPDAHMWEVIGEFLATQETVTAIEDGNLLIIDRSVMPYDMGDVHVVTWEFHDGSSVSIVGTSSDVLSLDLVA